jgi:Mg-chelatase subunit ChlD
LDLPGFIYIRVQFKPGLLIGGVLMNFKIENFYNPNLAVGSSRLDVILSVTSSGSPGTGTYAGAGLRRAIIFVIDESGSMGDYNKMEMAKLAVRKSINLLDENSLLGVIAFSSSPRAVVNLCQATSSNKEIANEKVKRLSAGGGTVMSTALEEVLAMIKGRSELMVHVQFVTDGQNDISDHRYLENVLDRCEGKFQCDCWGFGTDWRPDEIRNISNRLLGRADAAPDPERLEAHFKAALERSMSQGIGDVKLRLQMPKSVNLATIKQVSPVLVDLLKLSRRIDEKNIDIPLGAWGDESRDYQVAFELQPQADGEEMMACRPKIVFTENGQETIVDGDRVVAVWSSDGTRTSRINEQVAHYTGQEELASSIEEGLKAKARGDMDSATVLLGRAAKIAVESGNEEVTMRLKKVVDIVDAEEGTVRLKRDASKAADLELDMGGTMTIRKRPAKKE